MGDQRLGHNERVTRDVWLERVARVVRLNATGMGFGLYGRPLGLQAGILDGDKRRARVIFEGTAGHAGHVMEFSIPGAPMLRN
jgi:hypothetical protein